jgi:DNA-binding beta-propeller fold protein YncE
MKSKLTFRLSCILITLFIAFPMFQSYAKSNKYNHLELVGMSGISTIPGVFSSAYTPTFWLGNFFKQGMDFDQEGNLYLADSGESQIEVFSNELKPLRHFGSIGSQADQFQLLMDLKVSQNQVFALDYTLASVKVFHLDGTFQYEFSTQAPEDEFSSCPSGLAVSNHKHVFVMDLRNGLKMFDIKGKFIKHIDLFSGFNLNSESEHYERIQDLKTDDKGNLYLLFNFGGDGSPMVLHTDPEGNLLTNFQENCWFPLSHYYTTNGCFALENNTIYGILWESYSYVRPEEDDDGADQNHLISGFKYTYSLDPCEIDNFEYFFDEEKENPCSVAILCPTAFSVKNQQLFILDSSTNSLHKFSDQGELLQSYQSPERTFRTLSNISYHENGHIFVSDMNQSKVHRLDNDLAYIESIGEEADPDIFPSPGNLNVPQGVCTDWRNYLYVADYVLNCVQVFDEKGQGIASIYPQETFGHFSDLAINDKGNLVVSSVSYGYENGMMILEFDIQQIDQGKYHQLQVTPLPLHRYYGPYVSPEYGSGPFLPASEGGFVQPCYACGYSDSEAHNRTVYRIIDANGKTIQTIPDLNQRNNRPDQGFRPQAITYGADHSFFVVDHWCGVWWKFDDEYHPLWDECIQWFGIYSICTDSEGYIYAIDQAHSLVLKFKDHSFKKPVNDSPRALSLKAYPSMTLQDTVSISGSVNPAFCLLLDDKPIFVNRKGEFYATVYPKVGSNRWVLRVQGSSKAEHEKTIEIFRKEKTQIRMSIGKTQVWIDQEERKLEAPPFIDPSSKRSYCPIRMVVEAIGGSIQWLAQDQKVLIHLPRFELSLKVNSPEAYLNGKKISIDPLNEEPKGVKVVPKLVNGRVFLPLRFVAEQLKYRVEWKAETQEIRLHYPNNVVLPEAWNKLARN